MSVSRQHRPRAWQDPQSPQAPKRCLSQKPGQSTSQEIPARSRGPCSDYTAHGPAGAGSRRLTDAPGQRPRAARSGPWGCPAARCAIVCPLPRWDPQTSDSGSCSQVPPVLRPVPGPRLSDQSAFSARPEPPPHARSPRVPSRGLDGRVPLPAPRAQAPASSWQGVAGEQAEHVPGQAGQTPRAASGATCPLWLRPLLLPSLGPPAASLGLSVPFGPMLPHPTSLSFQPQSSQYPEALAFHCDNVNMTTQPGPVPRRNRNDPLKSPRAPRAPGARRLCWPSTRPSARGHSSGRCTRRSQR